MDLSKRISNDDDDNDGDEDEMPLDLSINSFNKRCLASIDEVNENSDDDFSDNMQLVEPLDLSNKKKKVKISGNSNVGSVISNPLLDKIERSTSSVNIQSESTSSSSYNNISPTNADIIGLGISPVNNNVDLTDQNLNELSDASTSENVDSNIDNSGDGDALAVDFIKFVTTNQAFDYKLAEGFIKNNGISDWRAFLYKAKKVLLSTIKEIVSIHGGIKLNIKLISEYCKTCYEEDGTPSVVFDDKNFGDSNHVTILPTTDLTEFFNDLLLAIEGDLEEFKTTSSGWAFCNIKHIHLNFYAYEPINAGAYIQLPYFIEKKSACINVKNVTNDRCIQYAIAASQHPYHKPDTPRIISPNRPHYYQSFMNACNFDGIVFPISIHDFDKIEKQNPDFSFNVFVLKKKEKLKIQPPDKKKEKYPYDSHRFTVSLARRPKIFKSKHINILMYQREDKYEEFKKTSFDANLLKAFYNEDLIPGSEVEDLTTEIDNFDVSSSVYHFAWIKSLSALMAGQNVKSRRKRYFCNSCVNYFYSQAGLDKHLELCLKLNVGQIILPKEKTFLKFEKFKHKLKAPFFICGDIETILHNIPDDPNNKNTTNTHKHEPHSIAIALMCTLDDSQFEYEIFNGKDCIDQFMRQLKIYVQKIQKIISTVIPMRRLTAQEERDYITETKCHICGEGFTNVKNWPTRDHNHLTGDYRGKAHNSCNLKYQITNVIPVFFHNLTYYDAAFLLTSLSMTPHLPGRLSAIPLNSERYISFTKHIEGNEKKKLKALQIRFLDSYRFLNSSINNLASLLTKEKLKISNAEYHKENLTSEQIDLISLKGVFPYEYLNSWSRLNDKKLPPKKDFYSSLTQSNISDDDYKRAVDIWSIFHMQSLLEYSNRYLKTDLFLLVDIISSYQTDMHSVYGLDPLHFYTGPGFAWMTMLYYTGVKLELISDIDIMLFIESMIRGGVSTCMGRYAKADNPFMPGRTGVPIPGESYDYLMYFDYNNLYGGAMSEYLPVSDFIWIESKDLHNFSELELIKKQINSNVEIGYFFEVDLDYPEELHDLHNDFPFCAIHKVPVEGSTKKLLLTLENKIKYGIHYSNLVQCLEAGLILKKVHRVLKFKQSQFMKSYVDLNTRKRAAATSKFHQSLYKLNNNSVFGKSIQNVRNHKSVKLISRWLGAFGGKSFISSPFFKSANIFNENFVAMEMRNKYIYLNKPIYLGAAILDISKRYMYEFHYGYTIPTFGADNVSAIYTDTDSLIYKIRCFNIYETMKQNIDRFDTSDYKIDNQYNMPRLHGKMLGKMKDENFGAVMTEFVGLCSKMYATRVENIDSVKRAKGVQNNIVKTRIDFNDYYNCLVDHKILSFEQSSFRVKHQEMFTIKQQKVALNYFDDKRVLIPNSTHTYAYGHYILKTMNQINDIAGVVPSYNQNV